MKRIKIKGFGAMGFMLILLGLQAAHAARIKDIVDIRDMQNTQLVGYSLVVGLDGSGDGRRALFTQQAVRNMLQRFGISVESDRMNTKNVAAVMVTADLSPFAKKGSRMDVVVSSLGDATSLEGGTLLMTPLESKEGVVYAFAQGNISTGGINIETVGMERFRKNYSLVGRVPNGGVVEMDAPLNLGTDNKIDLLLKDPDFTTAVRIADAVNQSLNVQNAAQALDAATVSIAVPENFQAEGQLVRMMAQIEEADVEPDQTARVVINERTGTVVIGGNVRLSEAAVSQGNLTVKVSTVPIVSQPNAFSQGQTQVMMQTMTEVSESEQPNAVEILPANVNVTELANALNVLKVTPRDIISIFQALKQAGALQAELIIM